MVNDNFLTFFLAASWGDARRLIARGSSLLSTFSSLLSSVRASRVSRRSRLATSSSALPSGGRLLLLVSMLETEIHGFVFCNLVHLDQWVHLNHSGYTSVTCSSKTKLT